MTAWRSTAQNEKAQTIAQHERAEEAYREVATLTAVIEEKDAVLRDFHSWMCFVNGMATSDIARQCQRALALTPASLRERVAAERAVIEAARNHVHPRMRFGDAISPGITCAICAALAALAARPEAT